MRQDFSKMISKHFLFFIGILSILYFFGATRIDENIANKGQGYFVLKNIEQANEAGRLGYIKYEVNDYAVAFGMKWSSQPGVRRIIRSGPDDFDDIGYISLLQLIALAGKKITLEFVEKLHNYTLIFSLVLLAFIVMKFFKNILAGWIFMVLALVVKAKLLSLVYGIPDSRSFAVFFPIIVISIIILLKLMVNDLAKLKGWAALLFFGLLIGMMVSIRRSEGMMGLYVILLSLVLLHVSFKQKIRSVLILIAGYLLITIVMPVFFALHRDVKTGEFTGEISPYLQTTGSHPAWHSIVIGMGRYPNSLGMRYDDLECYKIVRSIYPDAMHPVHNIHGNGYYQALKNIYWGYVINNPVEYFKYLVRAYSELFYFIPYATSTGNLPRFYGYLPAKPGIGADAVDVPMDQPPGSSLLNLKFRYLKLKSIEWGIYISAIIFILIAYRLIFFGKGERENKNIFLAVAFYMFMLTTARALIPVHGLSLVVGFWTVAIISLLYVCFNNNNIRWFLYKRMKLFNL